VLFRSVTTSASSPAATVSSIRITPRLLVVLVLVVVLAPPPARKPGIEDEDEHEDEDDGRENACRPFAKQLSRFSRFTMLRPPS
jgi:hypothetical protein